MEYRRAHPIYIVKSTSGYIVLLIFPLLRALLYSGGDLFTWLTGAWFDILILILIVILGFINWCFDMFNITDEGIYIFKGVLRIKKQFIYFKNISSIIIEKPFYLLAIRAVNVKVDTDAGDGKKPDLAFSMRKSDAEKLLFLAEEKLIDHNRVISRVYSPRVLYITILSLISSNSLSGILLASTFISQSGNLLGREFEQMLVSNLTNLVEILAFGVPPVAATIAYVLIGGWMLAFLINILRNTNFTVTRRDNSILLRAGVFTTRHYLLNVKRINLAEIRQTLFTKVFGFYSVFINCAGYGKQRNSTSILIPAAGRKEAMSNLKLLLPEITFIKRDIKPGKKDFRRFVTMPSAFIVGLAVLTIYTRHRLYAFRGLILFVGIMLEIIPAVFLVMGIIGYTHTGIGVANGMITASFTRMLTFCRISLPLDKISHVEFKQSMFQRSTDACNVVIYVYSEDKKKYTIKNISRKEAFELIVINN